MLGIFKKKKPRPKCDRPTYWTLGWSMQAELGFDDGTYLPRMAALILFPEYFDGNGEPLLDMLPVGKRSDTE